MKRGSLAGLGALAFAVLPFVGLMVANDPGGTYSPSDVNDYLKSGHRPLVFLGLYLSVIGIAGLIPLLARLRESIADETKARVFWGFGVAAATGFAGGLAVAASVRACRHCCCSRQPGARAGPRSRGRAPPDRSRGRPATMPGRKFPSPRSARRARCGARALAS